jgi:hypothetical protein
MKWMDREVGSPGEQEAGPSGAVGSDARTSGQIIEPSLRRTCPNDEGIARIRTGQVGTNPKARILVGRKVLCAVDRDVDTTGQQRLLERGDEGALAPRRVRRPAVTLGLDDVDPTPLPLPLECLADELRLGKGEPAAPRPDRDLRAVHNEKMSRTACSS